jgi:hypothetical protein
MGHPKCGPTQFQPNFMQNLYRGKSSPKFTLPTSAIKKKTCPKQTPTHFSPILYKTCTAGKNGPKFTLLFKKLPKANNRPIGENSPRSGHPVDPQ